MKSPKKKAPEPEIRAEYDFSKATKNPYAKYFNKQVTIRLDEDTIKYFKNRAGEVGHDG